MAEKLSRRDLFTIFRRSVDTAVKPPPLRVPLRPPGAIAEALIADSCIRCGACVDICPRKAIKPLPPEYNQRAGTPHILPREAPCVLCAGLLCTTVCPSGTLRPLQVVAEVQLGMAEVNPQRCLPHRGEACTRCVDHCPVPGALLLDEKGRPRVTFSCTGCGLCEYYCPTEPTSIRVRPQSAQ